MRETVTLLVAEKLPPEAPSTAAGIFVAKDRLIHILSFSAFRRFNTWFKIPIQRSLYQSLAAHEVAHALTEANFQLRTPTLQAREYLAYVALFATMDPVLRERILRAMPGDGFVDEDRISFVVYMFDPMYFGVQAYRHYLHLDDGGRTAFLRAILEGKSLAP